MSRPRTIVQGTAFVAGALLVFSFLGLAIGRTAPEDLTKADHLYRQGRFDEAAQAYERIAQEDPTAYGAALGLGRVFMLRNSLAEAETWIKKAMALKPDEREPKALMGEILYRRDSYAQAAPFFEAVDQKPKAEKLRAFENLTPFEIESGPEVTSLPFVRTDPLPTIKVTINGQEGTFLIDTGGWELHVLPAFATKCGIESLSQKQTGTYAGGRQAASSSAVADRVVLGDFILRNVPVVLPERPGVGLPVDGIVGTVVLYHFIFTLDYPQGRLILRRNTPAMSKSVRAEAKASGTVQIPFWLAGDHFMYAWGTANGAGPYLFLIDTGMAGGGFTCPEYVVKEAKIELPEQGFQGMGGGGPVTVYPFTVDLTLGDARTDNVGGLYGALPPGFEDRQGFRMGGLISHGFFRPFAVTFDFQAMTAYLKKGSTPPEKN